MIMRLFHTLILLCLLSICSAQDVAQMDALLKKLDTPQPDTTRLHTLQQIAAVFQKNSNAVKSLRYGQQALELATRLNSKQEMAATYAIIWRSASNFDGQLEMLIKLSNLYEALGQQKKLAHIYIEIADIFLINQMPQNAHKWLNNAEQIIMQLKDSVQLCRLYNYRGTIYDHVPPYDSAIYFYNKELQIAKQINDEHYIIGAYKNLASCYSQKNNFKLAISYFDSVLSRMDTAVFSRSDPSQTYSLLGNTWLKAGNLTKALGYTQRSLRMTFETGNAGLRMNNFKTLASIYEAQKYYKLQTEALTQYYTLKDSIFNSDNRTKLTSLEADHQLERSNAALLQQQAAATIQRKQRNIFILISASALLLLTMMFYFFRKIKTKNVQLSAQNLVITEQKETLQQLNGIKDRLFSIISHDLRSPLTTLKNYFHLEDNNGIHPDKQQRYKQQTRLVVNQTSDMLENLLLWARMEGKNLQPQIVQVQLKEIITDATAAVELSARQKDISIVSQLDTDTAFADEQILRIAIRNIAGNAVKFSHPASAIQIHAYKEQQVVKIAITDTGTGMSPEQLQALCNNAAASTTGTGGEKGAGLGLFLVMELLKKSNAGLEIESSEGTGSRFTICLPA